ncbi:ribonuclease III family protein [Blattabacterium cuenoti]|uniref:ribonuclease III family protein n=1 Tax=Blattabacterium cuenoti TaxID=1653831 RepID=UPI00163CBC3A|nr:ribonuclease III domain-containing protein [Blattabacterium cuenoti]
MLSDNNSNNEKFSSILVKRLSKILGFKPRNTNFLKEVLIYSFPAKDINHKKMNSIHFQRLEFLGDAVLNTIVSHFLYEQLPEKKEGELTQIRSKIVCRKNLNELSKKLILTDLFLEKNLISDNILGNTLEVLIGFIYLDIGYEGCKHFINKIMQTHVSIEKLQNEISSYKVWIIEWAQKNKIIINFKTFLEKEYKNKNKVTYLSKLKITEHKIKTEGRGPSKKKSEEMASKEAYILIKESNKKK